VYCIATGRGTSVNALYQGLVDIIGHDVEIIPAPKRPGDIYLTYFDCSKAALELDWKAEVHLKEGLLKTVAYFKNHLEV
jgi:UDP-glucose 4-epimerase